MSAATAAPKKSTKSPMTAVSIQSNVVDRPAPQRKPIPPLTPFDRQVIATLQTGKAQQAVVPEGLTPKQFASQTVRRIVGNDGNREKLNVRKQIGDGTVTLWCVAKREKKAATNGASAK